VLAIWLALACVGSGVAVRVEDARGVSEKDLDLLTRALVQAVGERAGEEAVLDRGPPCESADRCLGEIRARSGTSEVILVRLIGVPTRIRLIAERLTVDRTEPVASAEVDLLRTQTTWSSQLSLLAERLMPEPIAKKPLADALPEPQPEPQPEPPLQRVAPLEPRPATETRIDPLPWVAIGAGAVALGVGIGFGVDSHAARETAAMPPMHTPQEIDALRSRAIGHAAIADVLYVLSAIGVGAGVALLAID
jgi:hypothetical protein